MPNKWQLVLICAVLGLAVVIAFEQVRYSEFLCFDDGPYVTENPHVNGGITYDSIIWAFTTAHSCNWHPLTWLSHMLDCELFGMDSSWHHLTNLLFHLLNTLLVFWILKRMTGSVWASAFVAAVFALHPLRVESVAWVAERKDVLSGFFWMLTILAYVRYTERLSITRYLVMFLLFSLGLMAKPMLVTLPFVLLLLDYWPLGRLQGGQQSKEKISSQTESSFNRCGRETSIWRLIVEKSPLFALSAASSVVTYIVQRQAITDMVSLPLSLRTINALFSYISYLIKTVYPTGLAILYPHPFGSIPLWQPIVCFAVLSAISVVVIHMARRKRYLLVGWFWYLGTLVPVIGLVQVGSQGMADRYTYLPSIGIYIMITWGAAELFAKWHWRNVVLGITAGVVFFGLLICTRVQMRYWRNAFTVFNRSLAVTKNNYVAHNNYGILLSQEGRFEEAIMHFKESVRINPKHANAHYNLGLALAQTSKFEEAADHLRKSLQLNPNCPYTMSNLAYVLAKSKNSNTRNSLEVLQLAKKACELTNYSNPEMLKILSMVEKTATSKNREDD